VVYASEPDLLKAALAGLTARRVEGKKNRQARKYPNFVTF
jgi:hypothetical protein